VAVEKELVKGKVEKRSLTQQREKGLLRGGKGGGGKPGKKCAQAKRWGTQSSPLP